MNYRENFEDKFGSVIETCSDDVLEAFDWLFDQLEDADRIREQLRKRISSLENENNVLNTINSAGSLTEENVDDLDEAISSLEALSERVSALKTELDNAKALCETILLPAENCLRVRKECEEAFAAFAMQGIPAMEEIEDETAAILVQNEEVHSFAEESAEEETDSFVLSGEVDDEISDMTEKLRVLVLDDEESNTPSSKTERQTEPQVTEDDDFSNIIFKYFSESPAPEQTEQKESLEDMAAFEEPLSEDITQKEKNEEKSEFQFSVDVQPEGEETIPEVEEEPVDELIEESIEKSVDEPVEEKKAEETGKTQENLDDIITAFTLYETVISESGSAELSEQTVSVDPKIEAVAVAEPAKEPVSTRPAPKSELQSIRASLADIKNKRRK